LLITTSGGRRQGLRFVATHRHERAAEQHRLLNATLVHSGAKNADEVHVANNPCEANKLPAAG
jgi:hypothetical protein